MHKKSFTFGLGVGILFVTSVFYLLSSVLAFVASGEPEIITEIQEVAVMPPTQEMLDTLRDMGYVLVNINPIQYYDDGYDSNDYYSSEVPVYPYEQQYYTGYNDGYEQYTVYEYEDPYQQTEWPYDYQTIYQQEQTYSPTTYGSVSVYLPQGTTAFNMANILYTNGVITDPVGFVQFLVDSNATTALPAGQLVFLPNSTFEQALAVLVP